MMEIKPNCNPDCPQEEKDCKEIPKEPLKIWILDYENLADSSYKGLAVVAAYDVHQAVRIFKSDSRHNGTQEKIKIGKIEQIPFPLVPDLIAESYYKIFD